MKRKIGVLLVLLMVFSVVLVGCNDNYAETEETESLKTGIVTQASMNYVKIQAPDGSTYGFAIDDNTVITGSDGLGCTLEVAYNGEYKENMIATKMTVTKESAIVSNPPVGAVADETIKYFTADVLESSMNTLDVKALDGNTYSVYKTDDTKIEGDVHLGATIHIFHKGNLKDGVVATSIVVIKNKDAATETTITGTVVDASNANIVVLARDGVTYAFTKDNQTEVTASTLIDSIVKITYTGDPLESPLAVKIDAGTIEAQE